MKLRFDTTDRKPKLYNIAAISAVAAAAIIILAVIRPEGHILVMNIIMAAWMLTDVILLLHAFYGQLKYNPYSYNTIYYSGFALFLLSVFVTYAVTVIGQISDPQVYNLDTVLNILLSSARNYMLLSLPFVLAFSSALFISNVSLIRHEGKRLVNVLGIILSLLMLGGEAFIVFFDYYVSGSAMEIFIHEMIVNLFCAVYLYFECMIIGSMIANSIAAKYEPAKNKDFIIILGCGIRNDGTPSPLLAGRIDTALKFAEEQILETGHAPYFVTSGGKGPKEVRSESAAMRDYLLEHGIEKNRIIEEDRSTSTAENMAFSKEKIKAADPEGKVAFSTTNYHVFRSGLKARQVKMRAVGMGARTKWYFWPNASVREFVGLLTEHRIKQVIIFGSMILIYVALTLLAYSDILFV